MLRRLHFGKNQPKRVPFGRDRQLSALSFTFEQKIQSPTQVVHRSIEIAHSLCVRGYLHSLEVEAQIIRKLGGTLDTLCRQSRQNRVGISRLLLCADPLLNGPCGIANVVRCIAKLAEHSGVKIARDY